MTTDSPFTGSGIAWALDHAQLTYTTENTLQAEIHRTLTEHGGHPTREVALAGGLGRIDLVEGRVGIEVKTAGGRADVLRQLQRYAHADELDELVLVTTRTKHHHMPAVLGGKPLHLVSLIGAAL